MKKLFTILLPFSLTVLTTFTFSQESLKVEKVHYLDSIKFDLNSPYSKIIDKNGSPINGWLINKNKKSNLLFIRHLKEGLLDGYSIEYFKTKDGFQMANITIYNKGEISITGSFDLNNKQTDSSIFHNLKSYRIWYPEKNDNHLISIEIQIKNNSKHKITKYYFNPEFNSTQKNRYRSNNTEKIKVDNLKNIEFNKFPKVINMIDDFFNYKL